MSFSASFCQNVLALPCVINMVPNGRLNPLGSMLLVQEKKADLKKKQKKNRSVTRFKVEGRPITMVFPFYNYIREILRFTSTHNFEAIYRPEKLLFFRSVFFFPEQGALTLSDSSGHWAPYL